MNIGDGVNVSFMGTVVQMEIQAGTGKATATIELQDKTRVYYVPLKACSPLQEPEATEVDLEPRPGEDDR